MSYSKTIDYLYNCLPMFSKQGNSAFKKDLTNIKKLCEFLGNPQDQFKSIHVAGTNGKGSSSHMIASVLQTAGYKTGLYTSPHLLDFRERIRLNGKMIKKKDVISFVKEHKTIIEEIKPSFFEVTVAMAFYFFAKHQVDIAVIETGLGGRLDSTNIINPLVSLITNISFDHTSLLGDTLQDIAKEKAGIIKAQVPVILSERSKDTDRLFEEKAQEQGSKLTFAIDHWTISIVERNSDFLKISAVKKHDHKKVKEFTLDLTGTYQAKNLAGVLCLVDELKRLGYSISSADLHFALQNVKKLTGLMGRWQKLGENPLIICDTGHNEKGWEETLANMEALKFKKLHMVIGIMVDKDLESLLRMLPKHAHYYFCRAKFERALPENELQKAASKKNLIGESYQSITEAIHAARNQAEKDDLLFIGGSSFVVAEALESFL